MYNGFALHLTSYWKCSSSFVRQHSVPVLCSHNNLYSQLARARWQRLQSLLSAFRKDCRLETQPELRVYPTYTFGAIIVLTQISICASVLTCSYCLHIVRSGSFCQIRSHIQCSVFPVRKRYTATFN